MNKFIPASKLSEIPDNGKLVVEVDDRIVVLVRYGDLVYCLDDVCTHDGGTLGDGELIDHCLVCPRHGAKFDVRTGAAVSMPATEPTAAHEVKIEDGTVLVKLSENS